VSNFLRKRHKLQGRGTKQVSRTNISEKLGVVRLRRRRRVSPPWAYDEASRKAGGGDREIRMSSLMSSDWKRSDGPD
jgi:hypothetical protein